MWQDKIAQNNLFKIVVALLKVCYSKPLRQLLFMPSAAWFRVVNCLNSSSLLPRRFLLVASDLLVSLLSVIIGLGLRFDRLVPLREFSAYEMTIWLVLGARFLCFLGLGLYKPLLRYSDTDIFKVALRSIIASEILVVVFVRLFAADPLPLSVRAISVLLTILAISLARLFISRTLKRCDVRNDLMRQGSTNLPANASFASGALSIVIYGAGEAGFKLSQLLANESQYRLIGFMDDAPNLQGRKINGLPIYSPAILDELIARHDVQAIFLAMPSVSGEQRQRAFTFLRGFPVQIKTIPTIQEILDGTRSINQLRNIDITDLLGREEVQPDPALLHADISGKVVLVTGGGGSIGAELCRQIVQQQPRLLVLYEVSEFALYSIELELVEANPHLQIVPYLGSITDAALLRKAITDNQVETIYHAAAYKHVPLVEANPVQGVLNNSYGTLTAAQVANDCKVDTFVLISTDKAVRPTNVMGATKRVAELILQGLAAEPGIHTRFVMVRFGNVLGSSGSVVPRFRKQIAARQPITITHPDITRYFMSIPEAARLVIQAGAMGQGGEVFLLNMGDPVRIYDLAVQMIELSGLQFGKDIDIEITGLRPGEKLYEELLINQDNVIKTDHPKIYAAHEVMLPWSELEELLKHLFASAQANDVAAIKPMLRQLVPEYQPANHPAPIKSPMLSTTVSHLLPPSTHTALSA